MKLRYLLALGAMLMPALPAEAAVVTVNYESAVGTVDEITGTLSYDTEVIPLFTAPYPGLPGSDYASYSSPLFTTTYTVFGSTFTGTFGIDMIDSSEEGGTDAVFFYTLVPETPINLNLVLYFDSSKWSTPSMLPTDLSNAGLSAVAFIQPEAVDPYIYVNNATYNYAVSAAVPEPATWAMMTGGFGLIGGTLRRRRRPTAAIA